MDGVLKMPLKGRKRPRTEKQDRMATVYRDDRCGDGRSPDGAIWTLGRWIVGAAMLAGAMLLSGTSSAQDIPNAQRVSCWFKPPAGHVVTCYHVQVPERRLSGGQNHVPAPQRPNGHSGALANRSRAAIPAEPAQQILTLPVVVISTPSERRRDDPVVYISGGPGDGDWLDADRIGYWWGYLADNPWLRHRDLILFDQRGVGLTEPRVDCPELSALNIESLTYGNDYRRLETVERDAAAACLARLKGEGHDVAAYTTVASSADLHDIFSALAISRWNVYGVSYGTRLALTYMRDFPEDIRSTILDSVYPFRVKFLEDDAWRTNRAFRKIIDGCAADDRCRAWYPDLGDRLLKLVRALDARPLPVKRANPTSSKPLQFGFTGEMLLNHLFFNMYNLADIERVPQIIDIFERRVPRYLDHEIDNFLANLNDRPDWGDAMATTINCAEDVVFNDLERVKSNYRAYPLLEDFADQEPAPLCAVWARSLPDKRLAQPVESDIPSLILSGAYDPVTPPSYARLAAATLKNGFVIGFPGIGHDVLGNDLCAGVIADIFLDKPTARPVDNCLKEQSPPDFQPPVD